MTNGIVRLEKLERVLLYLSLVVPTLLFAGYNLVVLMDGENLDYTLLSLSGKTIIVAILGIYLLTALAGSLRRLTANIQLSARELVTAKLIFMALLLAVLLVAAASSNGGYIDLKDANADYGLPDLKTFSVYSALVLYFLVSNVNRFSGWLRKRASLITVIAFFLFTLSWIFWVFSFAWVENEIDEVRYNNSQEWDTFGDLANDLWDANLLERELETMFPKGLGIKPVGDAVLLRVIPTNLESHTARLYFLDNRGILQADLTYGFDSQRNVVLEQIDEIRLIKQAIF